jgi:hypothetical protein
MCFGDEDYVDSDACGAQMFLDIVLNVGDLCQSKAANVEACKPNDLFVLPLAGVLDGGDESGLRPSDLRRCPHEGGAATSIPGTGGRCRARPNRPCAGGVGAYRSRSGVVVDGGGSRLCAGRPASPGAAAYAHLQVQGQSGRRPAAVGRGRGTRSSRGEAISRRG